jgi:hypothetical protein
MAKQSKPAFAKTTDSINDRGVVDRDAIAGSPTVDLSQDPDVADKNYSQSDNDSDTIAKNNKTVLPRNETPTW